MIKIALLGGECSGKTTLAERLADHFQGVWNPEFVRTYLNTRKATGKTGQSASIVYTEVAAIALGQLASERQLLALPAAHAFFDTTLLMTKVYCQLFYGQYPLWIDRAISGSTFDAYFLLKPDLPWSPDPQRSSPNMREKSFLAIADELTARKLPYLLVGGDIEERFGIIREKAANCFGRSVLK